VRILLISDAVPRGPAGAVVHAEVDAHIVGPSVAELLRAIGTLLDIASPRPPRLRADVLARVSQAASIDPAVDDETMMANLVGLTETTCHLECELPLRLGTVIRMELALPGGDPLITQGIVLAADELQLRYVCELLDVDADKRARIRMFLVAPSAGAV
jgi:hypothetical protein